MPMDQQQDKHVLDGARVYTDKPVPRAYRFNIGK